MASPTTPPMDDPGSDMDRTMQAWLVDYGPALRRYFEKRASPAEAEDMVQDVFLSLQIRGGVAGIQHARGYLFQVARSVLAHRRYNYPALGRPLTPAEASIEELSPERILMGKESLDRLMLALESLPPRSREALLLHRFEEATYASVARRMGITVSAVERLITRALKQLTATLEARR
ncbi:RNA polymerase sigma factor [Caulobacter mirabilis]|nr:sigma-70 family RNA polymerase sigma factor [Caulobacter mirabilis]